jgi:Amt family ammonium transporter
MVWWWPGPDAIASAPDAPVRSGLLWGFGALDFAGGTVVHINAGIAALVGALMLGSRHGYRKEIMLPHSLTLTTVGAGLLWVGWFGFNAGSNLESNGYAALAMMNTFLAAAAASVSWMLTEWATKKKPSLLGLASGVVAGLVAITPAAGFAGPMGAIVLGLAVSPICLTFCSSIKHALGYDDSLDAFGIHGIGGIVGAIGTAIVVNPDLGGAGVIDYTTCALDGDISTCDIAAYSLGAQLIAQAKAVIVTILWSGVGSAVVFGVIKALTGGRVVKEVEIEGLDLREHGEAAYHG